MSKRYVRPSICHPGRQMLVFGPIPSRRLGRSLGINNIPPKVCSYSCVYCQLGQTVKLEADRQMFYPPELIVKEVGAKVSEVRARGEKIDYVSFVPDGEPTLDLNLGETVRGLRKLGLKVAIITNSSLLFREDVRRELAEADLVSLKVDVVGESLWRQINRPHKSLKLPDILLGIYKFSQEFKGHLISETMLLDGLNDRKEEMRDVAQFLVQMTSIEKAYVAIPTRPPALDWIRPANENVINAVYQAFVHQLGENRVEYLIGYEGNVFTLTGDFENNLLSIASVHPLRQEAIEELARKADVDWNVIHKMIDEGRLIRIQYGGNTFYMRRLPSRHIRQRKPSKP